MVTYIDSRCLLGGSLVASPNSHSIDSSPAAVSIHQHLLCLTSFLDDHCALHHCCRLGTTAVQNNESGVTKMTYAARITSAAPKPPSRRGGGGKVWLDWGLGGLGIVLGGGETTAGARGRTR